MGYGEHAGYLSGTGSLRKDEVMCTMIQEVGKSKTQKTDVNVDRV